MFTHGDLQIAHVFADGDQITGVIDWTEAAQGDALYDLASLTLRHEEHLGHAAFGLAAASGGDAFGLPYAPLGCLLAGKRHPGTSWV